MKDELMGILLRLLNRKYGCDCTGFMCKPPKFEYKRFLTALKELADYITENYIPKSKLLTVDEMITIVNSNNEEHPYYETGYRITQVILKAQEDKITCNKGE